MDESDNKIVAIIKDLVRPIVTIMFSVGTVAGWFLGKLSDDAFLGIAGLVIGFWFQVRTTAKNGGATIEPGKPPTP